MNVSYDFSDKVAVVTGAASGIGRGIATALARSGARVALLDINLEQAEEAAKECEALGSPKALAFHADITSSDDLNAARDGVLEAFGTVHFLISHAGVATVPGLKVNPFTHRTLEDPVRLQSVRGRPGRPRLFGHPEGQSGRPSAVHLIGSRL